MSCLRYLCDCIKVISEKVISDNHVMFGQCCLGVVSLSVQNSAVNSIAFIPMLIEIY